MGIKDSPSLRLNNTPSYHGTPCAHPARVNINIVPGVIGAGEIDINYMYKHMYIYYNRKAFNKQEGTAKVLESFGRKVK